MKTTTTTRHNVSLSGGNKFINAFASFGYMYQGSMMGKDTGYDRFNLRSNVDFHPIDITKVSVDINLAYDTKRAIIMMAKDDGRLVSFVCSDSPQYGWRKTSHAGWWFQYVYGSA